MGRGPSLTPCAGARKVRPTEGTVMTAELTAPPEEAPSPATPAGRGAIASRAVAWAVVPVYLCGLVAYTVLDRRLGSPGLEPVEGLLLAVGFGSWQWASACSPRWARC